MKMYYISIFLFYHIKFTSRLYLKTSKTLYIVDKDYQVELNEYNLVVSLILISSYKTQITKN